MNFGPSVHLPLPGNRDPLWDVKVWGNLAQKSQGEYLPEILGFQSTGSNQSSLMLEPLQDWIHEKVLADMQGSGSLYLDVYQCVGLQKSQ